MAKKRKKGKKNEEIPFIIFTPEALQVEEKRESRAKIEGFTPADPGWKAVFAACISCESPASSLPVVFWSLVRWENGISDVCGLVHGYDGFFFHPQQEHTFIGYVGPGQEPEDLLARYFDNEKES
jgi:hypothetical protein